jgi:hypothetical protein
MENAPVIGISFMNFAQGADPEILERHQNWVREAYIPMSIKPAGNDGIDMYGIIKESPEYPIIGYITHYDSIETWDKLQQTAEATSIREDQYAWEKRGIREGFWRNVYELERGFRNEPSLQSIKPDTRIENAPFMHIEAYRLSPDGWNKYIKWFSEYGCNVFLPLFLKLPGFKGYDFFRDSGKRSMEALETEYPLCISLLYFDNLMAFENYTKSQELVMYQKALRIVFPKGLIYKWYVQYQLVKSWRK